MQAALSERKTDPLVFYVFDLLAVADGDLRPSPLAERKDRLDKLLSDRKAAKDARIRFVEHFENGS